MSNIVLKYTIYSTVSSVILCFTNCNSKPTTVEATTARPIISKDTMNSNNKLIGPIRTGEKGPPKLPKIRYENVNYDSLFEAVEIFPEPPGGMKKFREWINENYVLPEGVSKTQIAGRVMLSFIVEKNGSLSNIEAEIVKGYDTSLKHNIAQAAIDLLKKSKKWTPGIFNGRPVRTKYVLSIRIDPNKMNADIYKVR